MRDAKGRIEADENVLPIRVRMLQFDTGSSHPTRTGERKKSERDKKDGQDNEERETTTMSWTMKSERQQRRDGQHSWRMMRETQ